MGWYKNFVVVVFVVVMDGGSGGALPPRTPCWPPEIRWPAENVITLGGGRCPPRTPPAGRPLAGGEASSASPFSRLILIMIIIIIDNNDDNNNDNVGRGGAAPPAPPLLAGRWPAESLERFAEIFGCNE